MAKLNFTIDPDAPKLKPVFGQIERGDYPMVVVKSELKELRSGPAIATQMKITRGQYIGRYVFKNFLVRHPDPIVEARGKAELNDLCLAIGIAGELNDTEELHGKEFIGLVYMTKPKDGYDAQNAVRSFRPMTVGTSLDLLREKQLAEAKAEAAVPQTASEKARALLAGLKAKQTNDEPPF